MNKFKLEMLEYSKEFCRRLNELFKDEISYVYKITILQDTERDIFTVDLGIDVNNGLITAKNKIRFFTYNQFEKFSEEEKKEYSGNFYNASIMRKKKEEFTMKNLDVDFWKICNFNYLQNKEEEGVENKMKEDKEYIRFILWYDLLKNHFLNSTELECDLVYEKCSKIADDFMVSEYNSNNKSLYDCVADYVRSQRCSNLINSLEENHTKTLEEWYKSKAETFTDFCKPGDVVAQSIVDYFINSLPPICFGENFIQAGGVFDNSLDKEDNLLKPTYTTFEKENGNWIYKGNCFREKNVDMTYTNSNLISSINKEINQVGYIEDSIIDRFTEMKEKFNWKLDLNENVFEKVLEKIKEDDELAVVLDDSIGSAIVEVKDTLLACEEEEASER